MATSNVTVTTSWVKLADDSDDPVLIQAPPGVEWEVAAMATETPPSVSGHSLYGRKMVITRDNIGDGYLYARLISGSSETFIVTK